MIKKEINNPKSYQMPRPVLFEKLDFVGDVLDVGCNAGANLRYLLKEFDSTGLTMGLDYNPEAIKEAQLSLSKAEVCDFNNLIELERLLKNRRFDTIIVADVLEHLLYPEAVVSILVKTLNEKGKIIVSLPNTGYYATLFHFFARKWPKNDRGIYDKTHIQIFFKRNLQDVVPIGASFKIIKRTFRLLEYRAVFLDKIFIPIIPFIPILRDFFTFQYIIKITKE